MSTRIALLVALLLAGTSLFLFAGPATASTAGAINRCNANSVADGTASVTVPGTSSAFVGGGPNQDPSVPLRSLIRPGDVIRVSASGQVSYGGIFNWYGTWGPNGNGELAPADSAWPYPGGPRFALVGTFNHTGTDVRLGTMSACLVVPAGGDGVSIPWGLWLQPNDDWRLDNGGAYSATVQLWRASLSP